MKAMILAAGFGRRLLPFTQHTPKCLMRFAGQSLLERALLQLKAAGCKEVMINVAHLGHLIQQHVQDGARFGLQVHYSKENPLAPLDTGAGVWNVRHWLGEEPFLLLSADIFTDFSYKTLLASSVRAPHLVVVPTPTWVGKADFFVDDEGALSDVSGDDPAYAAPCTYAGFGVFCLDMWRGVEKKQRFGLGEVLRPLLKQQALHATCYHGIWHNVGCRDRVQALLDSGDADAAYESAFWAL